MSRPTRIADASTGAPHAAPVRVLVLDDDADHCEVVTTLMSRPAFVVEGTTDTTRALALVRTFKPDVLVTDLRMPGRDGFEVMAAAHALDPQLGVVVMTGLGSIPDAVHAMKSGAEHFLAKPVDARELLAAIDAVVRRRRAQALGPTVEHAGGAHVLVGESAPMRELRARIARVAPWMTTVLLLGETGTGKERVAEALHAGSPRAAAPFVRVNCSAFAETLLESELFGHEKGAFTGAQSRRDGRFRLAQGGTLLLDEIGELAPAVQVKLLRVLQEHTYERVGGNETFTTDVRIVAATHRDLPARVAAGQFREDLYYRLNVVALVLPPLRTCRDDIPRLAAFFLARLAERMGAAPHALDADALRVLLQHDWPGNVRELENVLESAVVMAQGDTITANDLSANLRHRPVGPAMPTAGMSMAEMEQHAILTTYEATGHSAKRTAEVLGLSVRTVHYRLTAYGRGER